MENRPDVERFSFWQLQNMAINMNDRMFVHAKDHDRAIARLEMAHGVELAMRDDEITRLRQWVESGVEPKRRQR